MADNPVPANPADPRVIDVCVELLEAGRPLTDIMNEAKRLSAIKLEKPLFVQSNPEQQAAAKQSIAEEAVAAHVAAERVTEKQSIAEPVDASRKVPALWLSAVATLLLIATGTAGVYLPRVMTSGSRTALASASVTTASPVPVLSPTTTASHNAGSASQTSAEIAMLVERGSMLLGSGDLSGAREVYGRAADAGDARAAIYLGTTYDPSFLKQARFAKVVRGDRKAAAYWYSRARDLGASDADALLKTLRK